jgi:hypothetical protein
MGLEVPPLLGKHAFQMGKVIPAILRRKKRIAKPLCESGHPERQAQGHPAYYPKVQYAPRGTEVTISADFSGFTVSAGSRTLPPHV